MSLNTKNHIIIIICLIGAVVLYFGGVALTRTEQPAPAAHDHSHETEMADFINNLPTEFEPLASMGNALMDRGDFVLAVECYRRALEVNPASTDVRTDLAACQNSLGQNQEAVDNLLKVLAQQPDHKIAKFNLGVVYITMGDVATANQWWDSLLAENPPEEMRQRVLELRRQFESHP